MLFKLCDWEQNGYSDSDWHVVLYNDETNQLSVVCYDTTRFAPDPNSKGLEAYEYPTKEIAEKARLILEQKIYEILVEDENRKVFEPNDIAIGQRVVLSKKHKNQAKEHDESKCLKCSGSGKWINPKNADDKRECFTCKGSGIVKNNFRKVKNEQGKPTWINFEPGIKGVVSWEGTFQTIYRNGYNQRCRGSIETRVLLDDGREMSCPLSKLSLDKIPTPEIELKERANELSYNYQFGALFPHFTWESNNWARQAAKD